MGFRTDEVCLHVIINTNIGIECVWIFRNPKDYAVQSHKTDIQMRWIILNNETNVMNDLFYLIVDL